MEEERKGKFENGREEVLYRISLDGWANAIDGHCESSTGTFAKIIIEPEELAEITEAFEEEIEEAGLTDTQELIGRWLLLENGLGQIALRAYEGLEELNHDYQMLSDAHSLWLEIHGE